MARKFFSRRFLFALVLNLITFLQGMLDVLPPEWVATLTTVITALYLILGTLEKMELGPYPTAKTPTPTRVRKRRKPATI